MLRTQYSVLKLSQSSHSFEARNDEVGRFHTFYRPRRPLGRVEVQLYSIFRPRYQKGVRGQRHVPAAFYPRERPGTHCTGGWVDPRASLDGRKISSPPGFDPWPVQSRSQSLYRLSYPARSDEVKGYKTRSVAQNITVSDAGIFSNLEIRKAANLIHYYFWRQYFESSRETTFFCCPKLITIVMLFKKQYCL